jgi:VanZ family protein
MKQDSAEPSDAQQSQALAPSSIEAESAELTASRSLALPLALAYSCLIVYASLYPFVGWLDLGESPFDFLWEGWPRYWIASDLVFNVIGYMPLGALLVIWLQRGPQPGWRALLLATLLAGLLSLSLETLQNYLPQRVASNVDWGLNVLGAAGGGLLSDVARRIGLLALWRGFKQRWFAADARGAITLLVVWPAALLFPAAVPFGVGQLFERMSMAMASWVQDTAYADWFPLTRMELEPLTRLTQALGSGLGLLLPVLLGFSVVRSWGQRLLLAGVVTLAGFAVLALSSSLSYGPSHVDVWMTPTTLVGVVLGLLLTCALLALSRRACLLWLALVLVLHLVIVNQAPTSPYLAETLQVWERGQFIHFHGLAQWVAWLWPYATLFYVIDRLSQRAAAHAG